LASIWRNNSPNGDAGRRDNMSTMKKLLIVYQSLTGGTAQMAAAAAEGAAGVEEVTTQLMTAAAAGPEQMLASDGYLFACPENLASMAGLMKDFFDRSYYPVLEQLNGRPYATLICAGSDGSNAARQIERIATGWRLREIAQPLIVCTHAQTPERILAPKRIGDAHLAQCRELGATIAAGLSLGLY
jgi:multimeric flavodoxin WrbA